MRRSDREIIGLSNLLAVLDQCEVMRVGLCADNTPYIVPMNFAYEVVDGNITIYFHSASEGRKLDMIARNNHACFEADCLYRTLTAERACDWSAEFQSVMGEGEIAPVTDDIQKIRALDILMKRHGFVGKPDYRAPSIAAVTVLRISVTSITGKSKMRRAAG